MVSLINYQTMRNYIFRKEQNTDDEESDERDDFFTFLLYVIAILFITFIIIRFVCQVTIVSGSSMWPALNTGDCILIDKTIVYTEKIDRYDILTLKKNKDTDLIKRVYGLPGETVDVNEKGQIFINNVKIPDEFAYCAGYSYKLPESHFELGKGEYVVFGDNRNNSLDSRDSSLGIIKKEQIIGKAVVRIYPFDKIRLNFH